MMTILRKKIWRSIRDEPPEYAGFYEVRTKERTSVPPQYSQRLRYWNGKEWFLVLDETKQPAERSIPLSDKPFNYRYRTLKKNKPH